MPWLRSSGQLYKRDLSLTWVCFGFNPWGESVGRILFLNAVKFNDCTNAISLSLIASELFT